MKTVELHQAFLWDCDHCGRGNFARGVTVAPETIDPDDLPNVADREAVAEWVASGGSGDFVVAPRTVTCEHCKTEYATEHT